MSEATVTAELAAEHGLNGDEYQRMLEVTGRTPSLTELGIFSAMWSEHCSYKSSRVWLAKLPTEGPQVIQGPGENAGVVDIGDGMAVVFKMESHNHPSFIEPYQGAATGVGGILRDVFTMGARPVANLNALRFGDPEHPKTRHLLSGVVAGIAGYGNCIGVPTVGGEVNFHPAYNGNILVNAMTVGIARSDRIFYARAAGIGNPVVYVGAKTGRDGIHGATMSSAEFSEDSEEKRPTVQVGDPFTEKLLLEACLELMATDAIIAIQDMGAAGLTSSSVEMADKGGVGIELELGDVPTRETAMTPYEIMLSESQERMLMVLKPGREDEARAIFEKWELDFATIGRITDTGRLVVRQNGTVFADLPVAQLVDQAPKYERPFDIPSPPGALERLPPVTEEGALSALVKLIGSADLCSRRWITEQYDHLVGGETAIGPSVGDAPAADAAIIRVTEDGKALAMTVDCTPRYCKADPVAGGAQAVAEAWRNLCASGARPLAVTDNMNFGNPEKPEIMGQFAGCITGMAEACAALDFPVVSGNVSLYNETDGRAILPTPAIGGVGVIDDIGKAMRSDIPADLPADGATLILIGNPGRHLGQSLYLREILGREDGPPPRVDLHIERGAGEFVRALIQHGMIIACHDISDGGMLVAAVEMAMPNNVSLSFDRDPPTDLDGYLFGEDQGRYLICTTRPGLVLGNADAAAIAARPVATAIAGDPDPRLKLFDRSSILIRDLRIAHEARLPSLMRQEEGL